MVNILAKSDPPGWLLFRGSQKNKGQIGNLLSGRAIGAKRQSALFSQILHLFAIQTEEIAFLVFFTT